MKAYDIFGLIVRTIGLLICVYAGFHIASIILVFCWPGFVMVIGYVFMLAVGLWLLRGARRVMRYAYPEEYNAMIINRNHE